MNIVVIIYMNVYIFNYYLIENNYLIIVWYNFLKVK